MIKLLLLIVCFVAYTETISYSFHSAVRGLTASAWSYMVYTWRKKVKSSIQHKQVYTTNHIQK